MLRPLTGLAAFAFGALRSPIRLLNTFTKVPPETKRPLTEELALLPDKLQMEFLNTFVAVAPDTTKPLTAAPAVDDNVLIALPLMLTAGDVLEQVIPTTAPPVPVEVKFVIVLLATFNGFPPLKVLPI